MEVEFSTLFGIQISWFSFRGPGHLRNDDSSQGVYFGDQLPATPAGCGSSGWVFDQKPSLGVICAPAREKARRFWLNALVSGPSQE